MYATNCVLAFLVIITRALAHFIPDPAAAILQQSTKYSGASIAYKKVRLALPRTLLLTTERILDFLM
jgi:hypothetical protein